MSHEPDWARVKVVFQAALDQPIDLRSSFVAGACGSDGRLRIEVESLLKAHDVAGAFASGDAVASLTVSSLDALGAADPDLAPGSQIDVYTIVSALGSGSMGQVLKALDSRLGRIVALKVLPRYLAQDPASRARFEREAKTIAALNHPHICTLFDVGRSGSADYLAMEYLEGETLATLLRRGPLSLDAARRYAGEVIDALDAAHRAGVVHRDLKPANLMITDSGAKLLDFGIATMTAPDNRHSSGAGVGRITQEGVVLGTAGYMSPEQARGQTVDQRTDIWAFGCLLFEMLSGRPVFARDTLADTLASVLEREPEWSLLPRATPQALIRLMRRCLERDLSRRLRDIADARADVEDLEAGAGESQAAASSARRGRLVPWVIAAVAVGAATIVTVTQASRAVLSPPPLRLSVVPPEGTTMASFDVSGAPDFALSPDAKQIVLVVADTTGITRLWVRALDATSGRILAGTDRASGPFWSADGTSVAFFADHKLKKISIHTGAIQEVANVPRDVAAGSWSQGGTILIGGPGSGLRRVSAEGGPVTAVTTVNVPKGELAHGWPQFLPDGRRFLFFVRNRDSAASGTYVGSIDGAGQRLVLASAVRAVYSPTGHLLFERQGNLMAQGFDQTSAMVTGQAVALPDRVVALIGPGALPVSVGMNTVAYWSGDGRPTFDLNVVDRAGQIVRRVLPPGQYTGLDLSRDGSRALVTERIDSQTDALSTIDLSTGARVRVTLAPGVAHFGIWAPDGHQLIFSSLEDGTPRLYRKDVPGNSPEEAVVPSMKHPNMFPTDWSPDGQWVLYSAPGTTAWDLFALRMKDRVVRPLVQLPQNQIQARVSPNARWIAYASDESGRYEVYVQSFDDGSGKTVLSTRGGSQPMWSRSGRELFYIAADGTLMAVAVKSQPQFEYGAERALFATGSQQVLAPYAASYAVGADGTTFLIASRSAGASGTITVMTNLPVK